MTAWIIGILNIGVGVVLGVLLMRLRQERIARLDRATAPADTVLLNVELGPPEFLLTCPYCGYSALMEDYSDIGHSMGCPVCEEVFVVLEPGGSPVEPQYEEALS